MAYHRPLPRGSVHIEPGIAQTTRGKYVCVECGTFNWWLGNMRRHIAEPHTPCRYCGLAFVHVGMHEWKCPHREAVEIS